MAAPGRLRVSSNGRYLEREGGEPFLYVGDTAWQLFHRLAFEEADRYLSDRARKGFTVIQAVALAELDGLTVGNANGDLPLVDPKPDAPLEPNEPYFAHVDRIVARANELGLVVGFLPTWGRYWKRQGASETGPTANLAAALFNPENARPFGEWLGRRYRRADLVWILGGDQDLDSELERRTIDAMAEGLAAGDGGAHLRTYHPRGPGRSGEQLANAAWIDFHMCQTSHAARGHDTGLFIEADYENEPARPVVDGEPRYEAIPVGFYLRGHDPADRFTDHDARQAAWWAILAGAAGHTYGNNNIWQMYDTGRTPVISANTPWHEALDHPGARQMGYLRRLLESRRFWTLAPCREILLDAPTSGMAKVRAALATDGSVALVYSPTGEPFTLRMTMLAPKRIKELWFNPRYCTLYPTHIGSSRAIQTFTPPTRGGENDWVLVLEDEAAGFPERV